MVKIGGNVQAVLQVKDTSTKNTIGERVTTWTDSMTVTGWLDLQAGDSTHTNFNAKLQESTHVFLCDYQSLGGVTSENTRMVIQGQIYEILLIDDPMGMHYHLEIYLKYVGGGQGVN